MLNSNTASQDTHANLLFAALMRQEARSVSRCDNQASGARNEGQETGTRRGKLETNSGALKGEEAGGSRRSSHHLHYTVHVRRASQRSLCLPREADFGHLASRWP